MINSYNFQAIIALNEYLIRVKKLDDVLAHLSTFLKNDFSITKIEIKLEGHTLFKSFLDKKELMVEKFSININEDKDLNILIYYYEREKNDIFDSLELIKMTFKVISQTLYNRYLEFKLNESSLKDSLTGLYNRQFVNEYLKSVLPLSKREEKKLAFLKVGVDHFKAVIDEFNYEIGDRVLKELAKSLEKSVRKSDIIARIDADEFLIVLHNISSENNAIIIANKIIENFKDVKVVVDEDTNQTLMKTICTGISIYPDDAEGIEEIYRSSDIALYEAKNKGRSQFVKFKKDESNTIELF
ncbi:GGDEF domain-containing protein [Halarcobacter ebronensis]|uniref:diguanylate cyclase n=1 Tax=Halarcobacter ebronensis TaxID=1462615 RepID=A0A4Q0YI05_9BACT|nr:GGDEF domain-containing protein [Halarcobacter ebronensis]RXJ70326.1 GGDEF domain-containing protein [Halarcobacter ebronensis]